MINSPLIGSRCRDGERSGENEVFSGREGEPSSPGASPIPPPSSSSKEPLKVMPAPPPKENAWAKRSAASTGSCDGEGRPPVSPVSPGSSTPPKSRWEHHTNDLETLYQKRIASHWNSDQPFTSFVLAVYEQTQEILQISVSCFFIWRHTPYLLNVGQEVNVHIHEMECVRHVLDIIPSVYFVAH